ncbi:MAG: tape measure protein [Candidatus Poribacteria bacterium]|nr:tape measure protein [Candidatus Poribacteria bacterium]
MSPGRPRDPATGRFISDTRDNSITIRELNTQLGEAVNRFEALGRSIPTQQIPQFNEGLLVGTAALVGMNAALQDLIGSQVDAAVALERQQVSLQTVTGSVEAATAQYNRLLEVARLPGINISQALRGSAQLQAIGLDGERAAEAIGAIGNALATSGQSAQEMTPIISGFRQLNAEGKILQEDLAIITTRIPSLIPLMREAFGGTRAEDVRKFYESIGEADRQTELFSDRLIEMLQTLPTISDTAGNALENLEDTAERLQARIGTHLLPTVKAAAAGLEDVLRAIENSDGTTRSIAVFGSFASTMLSIVTAGASVRGALLLLRPLLPALLGGPWGIAIAAVGALAGGFFAWRAATSEARGEVKNLNTFIAQNTELLRANEAAIESGSLAELRASETTIRKARDAAEARVEQLRQSAQAQFNELRGIKRSGEAFDELSGSLRRTSSDLEKAETELQRLNTTLKETNAEADRLEQFETNVNNLKTAITELNEAAEASEGIGSILRGDSADIRTPQSNLIKIADALIADLDTYNQIAEAARGADAEMAQARASAAEAALATAQSNLRQAEVNFASLSQADRDILTSSDKQAVAGAAQELSEARQQLNNVRNAVENLRTLQDALRTASGDYLQALQSALGEATTFSDFERIIDLADNFEDAFGNVDFLSDFSAQFRTLATDAITGLETLEDGLQATQAAIDELERIESLDPPSVTDATEFDRRLEAAEQELTSRVQAERAAAREREQSQRRNLRLGEQLDRKATEIFKEQLEERTKANQEAVEAQTDAREAAAEAREDAADRVAGRQQARRDDEVRDTERAEREKTRIAQREARRRERELEREARELQRIFGTDFASGLADAFDSTLFGDSVLNSLRSAESDITAFLTETFSAGTLAGFNAALPFIQTFFSGLFDSLNRPDNLNLGAPGITEAQLFTGQFGRLRDEERVFIDGQEVGVGFRLGDFGSIGDIGSLDVNLVNEDLQRVPLSERELDDIERGNARERLRPALDLLESAVDGIGDAIAPDGVLDQIREHAAELGLGNVDQLVVELGDASLGELQQINSAMERQIQQNERDEKTRRDSNVSLKTVSALLRSEFDAVRQILRDDEDSPLQDFLDNRQGLLRLFSAERMEAFLVGTNELIGEQREFLRAQSPEFAFVQDLERLFDAAEIPEERTADFLEDLRQALFFTEDATEAQERQSITGLRRILTEADIIPDTITALIERLTALFRAQEEAGPPAPVVNVEAPNVFVESGDVVLPDDLLGGVEVTATLDPDAEVSVAAAPPVTVDVDTEGKTVGVDVGDAEVGFSGVGDAEVPIGPIPDGSIPVDPIPEGSIPVDPIPDVIPVGPIPDAIPVGPIPDAIPVGPIPDSIPVGPIPDSIPVDTVDPIDVNVHVTVDTFPEEDPQEPPIDIPPEMMEPPEDTTEPPPEDTTEPPPEDTTAPPPEDTTAPPPEDITTPPSDPPQGGPGSIFVPPEIIDAIHDFIDHFFPEDEDEQEPPLELPPEWFDPDYPDPNYPDPSERDPTDYPDPDYPTPTPPGLFQPPIPIYGTPTIIIDDDEDEENPMMPFGSGSEVTNRLVGDLINRFNTEGLLEGIAQQELNLSSNTIEQIGAASREITAPDGVVITELPPMEGEVDVNKMPPLVIQGGNITISGGSVNVQASQALPVRIENIELFAQHLNDAESVLETIGAI